jgi:hypothetical protein
MNTVSEEEDWDFAGEDDAKMTIRAATRYLLKGVSGSDRGDVVVGIIEIVRQAVYGASSALPSPFDDEAPGG